MNKAKLLLSSFGLAVLLGGADVAVAQSALGEDFTCFQVEDSAKHQLQPGTRVFFKTRIMLVQRTEQSAHAHILADAGPIKGSVSNGTLMFDKRNIVLDPGVPVSFSIGQEICAVPAGAAIPNFLKAIPYYIAP